MERSVQRASQSLMLFCVGVEDDLVHYLAEWGEVTLKASRKLSYVKRRAGSGKARIGKSSAHIAIVSKKPSSQDKVPVKATFLADSSKERIRIRDMPRLLQGEKDALG